MQARLLAQARHRVHRQCTSITFDSSDGSDMEGFGLPPLNPLWKTTCPTLAAAWTQRLHLILSPSEPLIYFGP